MNLENCDGRIVFLDFECRNCNSFFPAYKGMPAWCGKRGMEVSPHKRACGLVSPIVKIKSF